MSSPWGTWGIGLITACFTIAGCAGTPPHEAAAPRDIKMSDALAYRDGTPELVIVSPSDGAVVTSPLVVQVEPINYTLSPSGQTVDGQGHVHLLIDQDCYEPGAVIPDDSANLHAGTGATRITAELSPGPHRLCLQMSDGFHVAVAILDQVEVTVVPISEPAAGES